MNKKTTSHARIVPRRKRRGRTLALALLFLVAGGGLTLYPTLTDLQYQLAQWRLDRAAEAQQEADATFSPGDIALPDGAVAHLSIPALGVEAYVLEGTDKAALARGPGHYPQTPLPGEPGNAAIAGHRTMHGHVFGDLDRLSPGDEIRTLTRQGRATYRVVSVTVVAPHQTEVAAPTTDDRLTLTTCHPKGSAAQRLVVVAARTD
jgi:sortase A